MGYSRRPRRGRVEGHRLSINIFQSVSPNPAKGLQRITLPAHASAPPAFRRSLATWKSKKGCVWNGAPHSPRNRGTRGLRGHAQRAAAHLHLRSQNATHHRKTRAALKELQSGRKSAYEKLQQEAILPTPTRASEGRTRLTSPKNSCPPNSVVALLIHLVEVARLIGRAARLEEAKAPFGVCVGQASQSS